MPLTDTFRDMGWRLVLVVAGALLAMSCGVGSGQGTEVAASQGVTPVVVDGIGVIVVRQGSDAWAFPAGDRRQERLQYCEEQRIFVAAENGSVYDTEGTKLGGPSPAHLDRFSTEVVSESVVKVFPQVIIEAAPLPNSSGADAPPWIPRVAENWPDWFLSPVGVCSFDWSS